MKTTSLFLLTAAILLTSSLLRATTPWHDLNAPCRLEYEQKQADDPAFLDMSFLCLPFDAANGARAFDKNGLPLRLIESGAHRTDGFILEPSPDGDRTVYIYFGYNEKVICETTAELKEKERLAFLFSRNNLPPQDPEKWLSYSLRNRSNVRSNTIRNMNPWSLIVCNHVKKEDKGMICSSTWSTFGLYSHRPSYLFPYCRRHVLLAAEYQVARNFYLNNLPEYQFFCCNKYFPSQPDYVQMAKFRSHCSPGQINYRLRTYKKTMKELKEQDRADRKKDPKIGLEEDVWQRFMATSPGEKMPSSSLSFSRRASRSVALFYRGKIYVPEKAEYEFLFHSNSNRFLKIDDKPVLQDFSMKPEAHVKIELEKGIHSFAYSAHHDSDILFSHIEWKKPGDSDFKVMRLEDFSAGVPLLPKSISYQDGTGYPLFRYRDDLALFTEKMETLICCSVQALITGKEQLIFAKRPSDPVDKLAAGIPQIKLDDGQHSTMFRLQDPYYPRVRVPAELTLKTWSPLLMFDDENLTLELEAASRLPVAIKGEMILGDRTEEIRFQAVEPEQQNRFSDSSRRKFSLPLDGDALYNGKEIPMKLRFGGTQFAAKNVRTVPVTPDMPDFRYHNGQLVLTDDPDTILIPVMHRPTLNEQREWQVLRQLKIVSRAKNLLVIAEDIPGFKAALNKNLPAGYQLKHFVSYPAENGAPLPAALNEIKLALSEHKADTVLIIPPMQSRRTAISVRDEGKCVAFVLDLIRHLAAGKEVLTLVSGPIPSAGMFRTADTEAELVADLRNLCRSYQAKFVELPLLLKQAGLPADQDFISTGTGRTHYPAGCAEKIAELTAGQLKD